jgi:deferrochelatase/peroxidase EfeB
LPPDENGDRDIGRNGSYLVVRQLEQNVAGFHAFCRQAAQALARYYPADARVTPEYVAAKMVGRWPDGRSLVRSPHAPTPPAAPEPAPSGGAGEIRLLTTLDGGREVEVRLPGPHGRVETTLRAALKAAAAPDAPRADNDFLFGEEDPQGLRCPFGAHIRRSNPRDSFDPGSPTQLAITNRHRILRVGRVYKPKLGQREGLLFMCLNGDIERQFEFIQQTWTLNRSFHGLQDERDPLTAGAARTNVFTVPTRTGPALVSGLGDVKPAAFVRTRGGGYFFLPGRRLLEHLAGGS